MSRDPLDWLAAVLATWQIVQIWHRGSLFAGARERVGANEWLLAELVLCPFCLSFWVGAGCAAAAAYGGWPCFVLYALAVSRAANVGHDVVSAIRAPRIAVELPADPSLEEYP